MNSRPSFRFALAAASVLLLSAPTMGQGETCANPELLTGLATHPFDTTGFADSPFDEQQNCDIVFGPGENLNGDGFFVWAAPVAGDFLFVAEGRNANGIDWPIQMAIYDGSDCTATCLANDNSSGPNQAALIRMPSLAAGQQLLIQVGGYDFFNNGNPTTYQGLGTLDITNTPLQCQNPAEDAFEDNDDCQSAVAMTPGTYTGLFLSIADPDYFAITVPGGSNLRVDKLASDLAMSFAIYNSSCQLIDLRFTDSWIYTNSGSSPETITVQPRRSNLAAAIPCTSYDLAFTIMQDPCIGAVDDAFEDNDFSNQRTPLGNGAYPGLFLNFNGFFGFPDDDHYALQVAPGATVQAHALFAHSQIDVNMTLRGSNGNVLIGSFSDTDNEVLTWTNTTGSAFDATLKVGIQATGTQTCGNYDLIITGLDGGQGQEFCNPTNNSTGGPARLIGTTGSGASSGLHLEVLDGPPDQFAFLLVGNMDTSPGVMVSDGVFCLAGAPGAQFFRYNIVGGEANSVGRFDASGVLGNLVGTSTTGYGFDVPAVIPGHGLIMAGETWFFQCWHRDTPSGVGRSNLSNGLGVTF